MTETPVHFTMTCDFTSPRGEGQPYAHFRSELGATLMLDWDVYEDLGEPVTITVGLVAGEHLAARSYSSA